MIASSSIAHLRHIHNREIEGEYGSVDNFAGSGSTADAFGSWLQLIADIGDRDIGILSVQTYPDFSTSLSKYEVELGIGAGGSESRIFGLVISTSFATTNTGFQFPLRCMANRRVPANSRLAVRIRDNIASSVFYAIAINFIKL